MAWLDCFSDRSFSACFMICSRRGRTRLHIPTIGPLQSPLETYRDQTQSVILLSVISGCGHPATINAAAAL